MKCDHRWRPRTAHEKQIDRWSRQKADVVILTLEVPNRRSHVRVLRPIVYALKASEKSRRSSSAADLLRTASSLTRGRTRRQGKPEYGKKFAELFSEIRGRGRSRDSLNSSTEHIVPFRSAGLVFVATAMCREAFAPIQNLAQRFFPKLPRLNPRNWEVISILFPRTQSGRSSSPGIKYESLAVSIFCRDSPGCFSPPVRELKSRS